MERLLLLAIGAALALAWVTPAPMPRDAAEPVRQTNEPDTVAPSASTLGNGLATVTLTRADDGHFYAEAQVNGARIRFLVDSGASVVALTRADAQAAGLGASAGEFSARAATAGGEIALKPVTIDRIAIGPLVAQGVPGVVSEGELGVSLLGQSFLRRLGKVEIERNEMRLR